jgi:hypothetical protein
VNAQQRKDKLMAPFKKGLPKTLLRVLPAIYLFNELVAPFPARPFAVWAQEKSQPKTVNAALQAKINQAIDKGVGFLRRSTWPGDGDNDKGLRALVGWTLLEAGVPATDSSVQDLARTIRVECIRTNYTSTYSLSLAILFFDKLADPADDPLIHSAAVRLLAGQNAYGGWTYQCPPLSPAEEQRLVAYLQSVSLERSQPGKADLQDANQNRSGGKKTAAAPPLAPEIIAELKTVLTQILTGAPSDGDNSNTQFAVMGLWAARRHQIPIQRAMDLAATRFRLSQFPNGGWGYQASFAPSKNPGSDATATMTCVGLYVMASNQGLLNKAGSKLNLMKFINLEAGLTFLGTHFTMTGDRTGYYLFALAKTGDVYDFTTINGTDWYSWGAGLLVGSQKEDGTMNGPGEGPPDGTCFALLFLQRANPGFDLSANLKGLVKEAVRETAPEHLPKLLPDPHKLDVPIPPAKNEIIKTAEKGPAKETKTPKVAKAPAKASAPPQYRHSKPTPHVETVARHGEATAPPKIPDAVPPIEETVPPKTNEDDDPEAKIRALPKAPDEAEPAQIKSESPFPSWLLALIIGGPLLLLLVLGLLVSKRRRSPRE